MNLFLLLVAAVAFAATGPKRGVHRLPIRRTTVELDWRWASIDVSRNHHPTMHSNQQPLIRRLHEQKGSIKKHSTKSSRLFSKNILSGEDEIDFWSIYTTPVGLGNPSLYLDAIVDTSWSPFFAASANCTYDTHELYNCIIHPLYNSSLSTTYRADLSPRRLIYWGLQGIETYGRVSEDSLHVSDLDIMNQAFNEATQWHPGYITSDEFFDTVLGLALYPTYDGWGNFSAPGPFQNMIQQNLLSENIFALTLPMRDSELGEIVFGGLPENITRKHLVEVPLNNTRRGEGDELWDFYTSNGWQVLVENITMEPTSFESGNVVPILAEPHIAVVTSSFPYISLPDKAAKEANKMIGLTDGGTWVDCSTRSSLPDLIIAFGANKQIKLAAKDYLLEVYDEIYGRLKCVSTFAPLGDSGNSGMILLGSPFLTGLHSVFDADRKSIRFGNRR